MHLLRIKAVLSSVRGTCEWDGTEQVSATFGQALELELQKRDTVLVF